MATWTLSGKGIEDEVQDKSFELRLDTDTGKWQANGAGVDQFFTTKNGAFKFVGVPENGTQLVTPQSAEAAFLKALNGSSAVGSSGTGRASQKGVTFTWKLDSK